MKRSNLFTLLLTIITSLFIITGTTFANDDDWVTDTTSGDTYITSGNVGIGTTSPGAPLDVNGYTRISGTRPITISSSGYVKIKGDTGGWANGFLFTGSSGTDFGGFGAFGGADSLNYYYIGPSYTSPYMVLRNGNVGIGTTSPGAPLDVSGYTRISGLRPILIGSGGYVKIQGDTGGWANGFLFTGSSGTDLGGFGAFGGADSLNYYYIGPSYTSPYAVFKNGNVGIGTTSPQSKLAVNGKITAEEIEVIENIAANEFTVRNSSWSDFVFEDSYSLPTLNQVESYIKENKHLPDIPSAKQVEEEGLSMAEMMKKQMQKIEELTLYLIEMKKENEALKERVAILENDN